MRLTKTVCPRVFLRPLNEVRRPGGVQTALVVQPTIFAIAVGFAVGDVTADAFVAAVVAGVAGRQANYRCLKTALL